MSGTVRVVALVSGRVQGVGYRRFVERLARDAGLAGAATNLGNGQVEVVLEGPADAVRALVSALAGPDAPGTVGAVDSREDAVQGVRGFTTA